MLSPLIGAANERAACPGVVRQAFGAPRVSFHEGRGQRLEEIMNIRQSRRRFLQQSAKLGAGLLAPALAVHAADPIRMRAIWWGGQDRAKRTNEAIQLFEKSKPDLKIATESNAWGDYWTRLATQVAGGNAPDVIQMDYRYIFEYARRGALLPLDQFIPSKINVGDFSKEAIDSGKVDGKVYAVPNNNAQPVILYLNKKVLADAGISSPPSTFEELLDAVDKLKAAGLTALIETLPEAERYSYVFDGNSQALDHVMVSPGLLAGAAYDVVHVNAEFAVQASDHDPSLALLRPIFSTWAPVVLRE